MRWDNPVQQRQPAQAGQASPDFAWLVTEFVRRVPGAAHAVVVSTDGIPLAASDRLPVDRADQLSAVASGLTGLAQGGAKILGGGAVTQTVVEMANGLLLLMTISDGSCLAVLVSPDTDIGLIAYEMTLLADKVGQQLTPEIRAAKGQ
ncbi:roadblock/LC7 domain-containing protein [Amycolatopsis sp. H20-H5]|uniref:roadblock/LC7 domain-containing protein n=1 Tax=Amycolatopsis sp. H20-H5 TaxID=3046309 RepID=UPI002DBE5955|nr:roadblock/LC7 domain-containing protein [Amycolatopsis sp. H20-H5]MEC3979014.1 roadblock/LC7 domain-containing protein [Amycolatopsis sp. H20-H5]